MRCGTCKKELSSENVNTIHKECFAQLFEICSTYKEKKTCTGKGEGPGGIIWRIQNRTHWTPEC